MTTAVLTREEAKQSPQEKNLIPLPLSLRFKAGDAQARQAKFGETEVMDDVI